MISLSKLLSTKYPFRNYTKELRNVMEPFRVNFNTNTNGNAFSQDVSLNAKNENIVNESNNIVKNDEDVNMTVNYISNQQNQSVSQSFHTTPKKALSKYSPESETISDLFQEISSNRSIYMGLVNENEKTISIFNPTLQDDINIVILLVKDNTYATFEYKHSSFIKIKKTWNEYTRIDFESVKKPKHTKKQLISLSKELNFTEVKTSMKKDEVYNLLYTNFFGFH
jgi:hypothetical protein